MIDMIMIPLLVIFRTKPRHGQGRNWFYARLRPKNMFVPQVVMEDTVWCLQGSQSKAVRVGGAPGVGAKYVALVGLGKAAKVGVSSEWGVSAYQVGCGGYAWLPCVQFAESWVGGGACVCVQTFVWVWACACVGVHAPCRGGGH